MMEQQVIESRVDYLTATSLKDSLHEGQSFRRATDLAFDLIAIEREKGNDEHPWRCESFIGWKSGQVCVGRSERGLMFRLSGEVAAERWRLVYQDASNVSRIDTALTVKLLGAWMDLTRIHHQQALDYQRQHSPKLRVTRIDGGKHGNTLNIGSRSSDAYGRIYDKEIESGLDVYFNCFRYELEAKRKYALLVAAKLYTQERDGLLPASITASWFEKRGVNLSPVLPGISVISLSRRLPDDSQRLGWLRANVSKTVAGLIDRGYIDEVLTALGLSDKVLKVEGGSDS